MMMCIQNLVLFCQFVLKVLSKNQILTSIKGRNSVVNLRKTKIYNTNLDLVLIMCIQTLVSFCQFVLKIISKNQIFTSIKGRNSLANLRKTTIYNTKVDLVDDNVFTKFGLIRSIRFKDIEQKLNSDFNQGQTPLQICRNSNSSKLSCMSSIPATMKKIQLKMKALECSQDFSHYKYMGIFQTLKGS